MLLIRDAEFEHKRIRKDMLCNNKHKKTSVTRLILDKVGLRIRNIIRDKEGPHTVNKVVSSLE